ncbi:unnamed protein product, partial [Mesorhabditis belari]|uniref:RRM domain-containing protein n=1 Tax=Mesorhabditis belari TaxID=2138241 RepID=A0AAF3EHN3_9BILA
MSLSATKASTSTDSRTFIVTGLRFARESYDFYLRRHLQQFGDVHLEYKEPAKCGNATMSSKVGFVSVEEPIYLNEHRALTYAVAIFLTDQAAQACLLFPGKHILQELGYEIKIRRLKDLTMGNDSSRVYSSKIMITARSPGDVDAITEEAICAAFQPYGEIVGIEVPSPKTHKPKCWFVEFSKPATVTAIMTLEHTIAGHPVRLRRVLRMEDLKRESQRERERQHRQEWAEQRASTSQPLNYREVRNQSRDFATVSRMVSGSSDLMANYGYGTEEQYYQNQDQTDKTKGSTSTDFSQYDTLTKWASLSFGTLILANMDLDPELAVSAPTTTVLSESTASTCADGASGNTQRILDSKSSIK